jgi:hypothetical protein
VVLAVCPDVFHRVQFRCVGWQVLRFQTAVLVTDELLGDYAFVGWKPIPNHQNVSLDVAEQVFEKLNDLLGPDGLLEDLEIKLPDGEAGDDGEGLPVEVELQDRCLPPRRPRPAPVGTLAQAAFVYEDNRAPLFLSFFLISGQRLRFHSSIAVSFRSRARPTGCCTLQFSCPRMRQMCPG